LNGPPNLVVDDWVKCNNHFGVVMHEAGNYAPRKVSVKLVRELVYQDNDEGHSEKVTPLFHKWLRDYRNAIVVKRYSVWECKKIGHDSEEWKYLRNKLINDYNSSLEKRKVLWNRMVPRITLHAVIDNPHRSHDTLRYYKRTWLQMKVNVLDKTMWENLRLIKEENPRNLHPLWWYSDTHHPLYAHGVGANIEHLRNTVLELNILD
jgi:hypothetical protein